MYGAGNIGRGFIGQLFSESDYSVGFVDINKQVIEKLNSDREYPVDVVTSEKIEEHIVKNVYGIDGTDLDLVADEIAKADVMATAIGVNVLKFIAKKCKMVYICVYCIFRKDSGINDYKRKSIGSIKRSRCAFRGTFSSYIRKTL